ncbi:cation:proton antiporter [Pseudomonas proteolytica]|uniref:cation:proton antiporter n=1 Tax=Pseudomonas proteolytica TaxID=219574 RepID=UPI0014734780|nr:cation:proton antiporter [Pseudomonas proteolytica]NMZ21813.1 cation:proton antiporter [Pseudomonas proteolytica]
MQTNTSAITLQPPAPAGGQSAVGSQAEHLTLLFLIQLIVIFSASRLISWLSTRCLGQTPVAGEILAGLVLGPSLLGYFFPELLSSIFVPQTSTAFVATAQVGLILLMFQVGLEFEFGAHLKGRKRSIMAISLGGLLVPFVSGFLVAEYFWQQIVGDKPPLLAFQLFFATALSITALPILGRIFMELGLSRSRVATLTIGAAAIDDVCGWLILGGVTSIIASNFSLWASLGRILALAVFIVLVLWVVRPLVLRWIIGDLERKPLSAQGISLMLIVLFGSAVITNLIGVFSIIGGFIIGVALHTHRPFVTQWNAKVSGLVNAFFLPVFFAYTGLRTDIGSLNGDTALLSCFLVCLVAFASKFFGAYGASRWLGETPRNSALIGVCMNTRALMELVVLNVGYDLGVLPKEYFTMLVIMAIISTFIASPLIRLLTSEERRVPVGQPAVK